MVALAALVLVSAPLRAEEAAEFYARAETLEATAGQAELRRGYAKRLGLPAARCAEGEEFSCDVDAVYGQVYALDFFEVTDAVVEGAHQSHRAARGRLLLATELGPDEQAAFEDALTQRLQGLSATAYAGDRPGLQLGAPPLELGKLASTLPVWGCVVKGSGPVCQMEGPRGSYSRIGAVAERAVSALNAAVAGLPPDSFRTPEQVRLLARHRVLLESASTLSGLTWADRLATVPQGARFEKRAVDSPTGGLRDQAGDVYRGREGRVHGVQREVLLPPASLYLLGLPMWVTRWSFEHVLERFGRDHGTDPAASESIVIAVLPLRDSSMPEIERAQVPLVVPERALLDRVESRLEESATLSPALIQLSYLEHEAWPARGDWLVVSCLDDGTARYGVAPFAVASRVTNPQEACAAITRELSN